MGFDCGWIARGLVSLLQKFFDHGRQGAQQFGAIQGSDQGILGACLNFGGELVKAPPVVGGQIALEASKAKSVIACATYPVFRLPKAAAFDTEAGAHGMMRGVPEQLACAWSRDRWVFRKAAKKDSEFWAIRTKLGCRSYRKVDLQTPLQQQDSKQGLAVR